MSSTRQPRRYRATLSANTLRLERLEDRNLLSAAVPTLGDLGVDPTHYDAHRIIVALQPGVGAAALSAVNPAIAQGASADSLGNGLYEVTLQGGVSVAHGLAYFQALSYVRYAQPDFTVSLTRTPNDVSFSSQWGLSNSGQNGGTIGADIGAPAAWNVGTGSGGVIVAIIDTGVDYTHPDLAANIWTNTREIAGNGRDDDGNGFVDDVHGWDFANNDNNPMDDNGHGTHVAGVIGAVGNNGIGVAGINWNVRIMPLKFLDSGGSGSLSNAIRALNYAVANGAKVSNNSYGGGGYYQAFADAVAAAGRAGHIFVAAAGNDGLNTDSSPAYPASYNLDNIISVAATDRNDRLASFSNYGARTVDLGAPGVSIYSTYKGGGYATMSGTSMATPFVTGAVALLQDLHPTWTYRQIIGQILNNTDPLPALQGKTVTGGRLDLARALGGASTPPPAGDTSGPTVTSATFAGATAGTFNRVRLTFSEAINAATFTAADVAALTLNGAALSALTYAITPVGGTSNQFDVTFAAQSALGTYALTIGPDIRDTAGNAMNQNGNAVNGELADRYTATASLTASQTFYSTDAPKTIIDNGQTRSTLTINQDISIGRLAVKLNLSHTYDSDLRVWLRSPAGTWVLLFNRRGGSGDNIGTTFDDRASTPVGNGTAPFTGWYKPEQALSALAGQNARGTWTLVIEDVALFDSGRLNSWGLTFDSSGSTAARSIEAGAAAKPADKFANLVLGATLESNPVVVAPRSQPRPAAVTEFVRQLDAQIAPSHAAAALPEVAPTGDESAPLDAGPTPVFTEWLHEQE